MISFEQSLKILDDSILPQQEQRVPLLSARGLCLSQSIVAPESLPAFDNSAMDGWAVRAGDVAEATEKSPKTIACQGEIPAGDRQYRCLEEGKALRIFTGAPIPQGAQAVIAQEEVEESATGAVFRRPAQWGENIRKAGEDIRRGDVVLEKYSQIGAGQISLLAALGITEVAVFAGPRVAHAATGSELVPFYQSPKTGQIRDSVSPLLEASLSSMGLPLHSLGIVPDNETLLGQAVESLLAFDVAIITGGVSVGKYDGVRRILERAGVETLFWKVDMKPGKPIYFGRRKDAFVFGLPGNPLSSLVGFEFFVKPLIARWMGEPVHARKSPKAIPLKNAFTVHGVRKTHLVTVMTDGREVRPLIPQGSHRIGQLACANGLAILSGEKKSYAEGAVVPVHSLEIAHA